MLTKNTKYPPVEIGDKFYRWTVLGPALPDKKGRKKWLCECLCGARREVSQYNLYNGGHKSCGCLKTERTSEYFTIHGNTKNRKPTAEYRIWSGIKNRIFNRNNQAFKYYGGRGMIMHKEWAKSFEVFLSYLNDHLGPRPSLQHSIDRIHNDEGYIPGNIRWSTKKEQTRNRRSSRFLVFQGETLTVAEWAERKGISYFTLLWRIKNGYSEDCLFLSAHSSRTNRR